jgi:hypothetical protein
MASHLAKLEQLANGPGGKPTVPACQFDNFSDAYAQFSARAHVLTVRNEARSKNEPTTEQLRSLEESIGQLLVAVHRAGNDQCMSSGAIAASTSALDQHFRAILKLELAKKIYRGAE